MAGIGTEAKQQRMTAVHQENELIQASKFNLIMGGVVLYGLVINAILCATVGPYIWYSLPAIVITIGYVVCVLAGTWITHRYDQPIISFLGYNLVVVPVGIFVSELVMLYGGLRSSVVTQAFVMTALITLIMVVAAYLFPQVFASIGRFLFVSLIGIVIASIVSIFTGTIYMVSLFAAAIFALYIGYDFYRAQQYPKTVDNAIDCALDIYLDIINLFIRLIQLTGKRK